MFHVKHLQKTGVKQPCYEIETTHIEMDITPAPTPEPTEEPQEQMTNVPWELLTLSSETAEAKTKADQALDWLKEQKEMQENLSGQLDFLRASLELAQDQIMNLTTRINQLEAEEVDEQPEMIPAIPEPVKTQETPEPEKRKRPIWL